MVLNRTLEVRFLTQVSGYEKYWALDSVSLIPISDSLVGINGGIIMNEEYGMYNRMMEIFVEHTIDGKDYDVEDFRKDLCDGLLIETDPQDIEEDDYLVFQEALILLVRDDILLHWFGLGGLCTLHAALMNDGEHYYVYKEVHE